jgi:beta-glucosidase
MKRVAIILGIVALVGAGPARSRYERALYQNPSAPVDQRVDDLLARMTLEEKIALLGGDKTGFATRPLERLGIPGMTMTDGPVGVRWEKSTAFPAGVAMAASWDPDLVSRIGVAIGREAKAHGRDVLLGPCLNIHRVPQGGRNFESFGEDPYLASRMAVAYVRGVQGEGVIATAKHFAVNNQETERMSVDARVDERALNEIYLPAFKAAVQEAGAWAVMSAYNKLNGFWCSENPRLLTDILKRDWAFTGLVMSDWGAVHSAVPTANAGCDLEMPRAEYMNEPQLLPAIKGGDAAAAIVDDKVRRILRAMIAMGVLDRNGRPAPGGALDTPAHRALARDAAVDSAVLLKNDGRLLPLAGARLKSVAVVGPNAAIARTGGGGSSRVTPFYSVSPVEGIRTRLRSTVQVVYAAGCGMRGDSTALDPSALAPPGARRGVHGLLGEYFDNPDLQGAPVATRIDDRIDLSLGRQPGAEEIALLPVGLKPQNFSVRWAGTLTPAKTGEYEFSARADDGVRLFVGDRLLIDGWTQMPRTGKQATMALDANRAYAIRIEYFQRSGAALLRIGWRPADSELLREAVAAARGTDVALVFAGLSAAYESEGSDRETLALPANQEQLIQAVVAANPRTVVVLNSGAPIVMESWIDRVPAVMEAWYPGQEAGNAVAALLFGDRVPSGKLPATFLRRWEDSPAYGHFPGQIGVVDYAEGVFVGYRHFDRANIEPRFPFGHGLSYTTFAYRDLRVTSHTAGTAAAGAGSDLPFDSAGRNSSPFNGGQGVPSDSRGAQGSQAGTSRSPAITISFDLENTGSREGAEVAQVYLGAARASVPRPVKELKAFRKLMLKPGERTRVTVTLDRAALAFYDAARHDWVVEPGAFDVLVGSSSRDIRLRGSVVVGR